MTSDDQTQKMSKKLFLANTRYKSIFGEKWLGKWLAESKYKVVQSPADADLLISTVNIFNSKFIHQYYKQKGVVQNVFSFSLLSETEVCKMLKGLSPRKATGIVDLPAKFIRDSAEGIAYPISYIINLSLKTGVVPNEKKTARVIPLHKNNFKLELGNYRPVSILSTLSKILERAVHIQLEIYLKENDLF